MTDRPRALAVLIAVFLLGGIIGAGGSYFWFRRAAGSGVSEAREFRPGFPGGRPRMRDLLQLTPEQEKKFREIMAESRREIDEVRAEQQPEIEAALAKQQPRIEAILSETNHRLMSILSSDQQKKFESMWKEMRNRRGRPPHGGRGMQPPPPGP